MSTLEQRKRLRAYYNQYDRLFEIWEAQGRPSGSFKLPAFPKDLKELMCGAKTRAGAPCKQKGLYINGRCKLHGGMSTGPKTEAGKKRASENGNCLKKKQTP